MQENYESIRPNIANDIPDPQYSNMPENKQNTKWHASKGFLESFSIFQIWFLILFTIGVSVIYETDRKTAIVPTIVVWVLGVLGIMLQGLGG